jgi:Immunity protein 26
MSERINVRLGDYFRIPLPDGRWAYCQFVHKNDKLGTLVRVFDRITSKPLDSTAELEGAGLLFPPVFVGLLASVGSGRWVRIGNMPVEDFVFPTFRQAMGTKPGTYHDWRIWDGKRTVSIGNLPEHMRSLELKQVWGDEGLEERIVTGTYRGDRMF